MGADASRPYQLVTTGEQLRSVVDSALAAPQVALDTEFHRERTYYPRLGLIQLATPDGIYLVDPMGLDLTPLARAMDSDTLYVVHAAQQDLVVLERACGRAPRRLFDTQVAAGLLGYSTPSLVLLHEKLLSRSMSKGDRLTDWTQRPLTDSQLEYAAGDVAHLLELYRVMADDLDAIGRLQWAHDESELILRRSREPGDAREAWWRIKEVRSLRGAARGIAQVVAEWRELRARQMDVLARMVLADLALAGVAHHAPTTSRQLRAIRGFESFRLGPEGEEEILAAVRRGAALPPGELRLPPREPELDRTLKAAVVLASAWLTQVAEDLRLDQGILATRADLLAYLAGRPSRLAEGWRAGLIKSDLDRLIRGEVGIRLADGGRLELLPGRA
jgi:ribonuclease D